MTKCKYWGNPLRINVKMPPDYTSKKELQAMNGEVKSYQINDPMTVEEFQALPDDIKIIYIKALRKKFNVPDSRIAEMLGASQQGFCKTIAKLGLSGGKGRDSYNWDKEGWQRWLKGLPAESEKAKPVVLEDAIDEVMSEPVEQEQPKCKEYANTAEGPGSEKLCIEQDCHSAHGNFPVKILVAKTGAMDFRGDVNNVLATIGLLLGGQSANISIKWEITND